MEYVVDSEKPTWRQILHKRIKTIHHRDVLIYVGATTIYIGTVIMMVLLPLKLIPSSKFQPPNGVEPNVGSNNNYLPAYCPIYTVLANGAGLPLSGGPLRLPLQRPETPCRTFTSPAMEKLIANVTSRMVDMDLARLFENTFPNTLGISLKELAYSRYDGVMVQS